MRENLFARLKRFARERGATAGVEFAIGAPVMLGGLLVMTDVGLAFNAKMNLDQAVRTGAQFVMNGATSETAVENYVGAAAIGADPSSPGDVASEDIPVVDVVKTCECPGSTTAVTCDALCTGEIVPSMYYTLNATLTHTGIFLSDFDLSTTIKVQTR
jgi:Flp pilus assembly protein TadG